jgi:N-acetyl-gamma-glutamyl-phosphate reductase
MSMRVGVVGGRGVVGRELLRLLNAHPEVELAFASSSEDASIESLLPGTRFRGRTESLTPEQVAGIPMDALLLAAPNGQAAAYESSLAEHRHSAAVVDVSSDHRFDASWAYGLVEHHRPQLHGRKRIANPGCYATGAQIGLKPFLSLLSSAPSIFGVSGYSGAGAKPSRKNDVALLTDNLMPYTLVDHVHEREIGHHLGTTVHFMPHVGQFFAGISLTINMPLLPSTTLLTPARMHEMAVAAYAGEPLVRVQTEIPEVRDARGHHHVTIGGFAVDASGTRAVVVVTLDNLLKGAATQAVQNMNLALGLPERMGIELT